MFCDVCNSLAQGLSESLQVAALSTAMLAAPMQDAAPPDGAFVIGNVTVIDVEKGVALPERWVEIRNGVIEAVVEKGALAIDDETTFIDATGKYLIPGLFDAHVHYTADPNTFGPMLVAHGVTCVRDLGAMTEAIVAMRELSRTTDIVAPEIVCTGAIIDGDPAIWPFSEPCDTPEEARAAVRKLHAAGVDQIKVYSRLLPEVHAAAIDEAHKVGLKAVGHVPDSMTYDQLITSGQDCVEHLQGMDKLILSLTDEGLQPDDLKELWHSYRGFQQYGSVDHAKLLEGIKRMKDANIAMCPTVVVMSGIGKANDPDIKNDPRMQYIPASLKNFWSASDFGDASDFNKAVVPNLVKLVGDLHKAGVTLMVGTDLANAYVFPGFAVHDEMAFFAEAGVPAADILRSATIVPAKFCGVDDKLGSIEVGKTASLVLLSANPLDDIGNASKIDSVFLRGRHFDREALDVELSKVRDVVESGVPKDESIVLDLPGKVLFRGQYTMRFQEFEAGVEDFLITETDDAYHIQAHVQPQGGPQPASLVTLNTDKSGAFKTGEYIVLTKTKLLAGYTRQENRLDAAAQQGEGQAQLHQTILPEGALVGSPATAGDFALTRQWDLEIGESRDIQLFGFGFEGWKVTGMPSTVKRLPDETITMPDGHEVTASVFESSFKTNFGDMTARTWVHPSHLTIRSLLKMSFGELEVKLKSLATE